MGWGAMRILQFERIKTFSVYKMSYPPPPKQKNFNTVKNVCSHFFHVTFDYHKKYIFVLIMRERTRLSYVIFILNKDHSCDKEN